LLAHDLKAGNWACWRFWASISAILAGQRSRKNTSKTNRPLKTRAPFTKELLAEDTNPESVLMHYCEQTGLTFSREKRRVRILVVESAKEENKQRWPRPV
jgi:hypothetical protein